MSSVDTIIIGAGLTGLACAHRLRSGYLLLEKDVCVGGLTRTEVIRGYHFDRTGHWLHLRHLRTQQLVRDLLGDNLLEVQRVSKIYFDGAMVDYPFQSNLSQLPLQVRFECLWDAIQARIEESADKPAHDFEDFCRRAFGNGITDRFLVPYNRKLWGCEPTEITSEWCGRFFPRPELKQIVLGALAASDARVGYNASFVYPRRGGIEALAQALAAGAEVRTSSAPSSIHLGEGWIEVGGERLFFRRLVSSIPLPDLLAIVIDLPADVRSRAARLRHTRLRYVNYGVRGRALGGVQWLYVPDPRLPFYRIGCSSNAVPSLAPDGCSSLYVEVGNEHEMPDELVLSEIRRFFRVLHVIEEDEQVEVEVVRRLPYGYVVFDDHYDEARRICLSFLQSRGTRSIGRFGAWVYSSMEDALVSGLTAGDEILQERDR